MTYLAILVFLIGCLALGRAMYRWVTYAPMLEVTAVDQRELAGEAKLLLGRDQSRIDWGHNPFSLARTSGEGSGNQSPVNSNLILKGTVIGSSKTAVLSTKDELSRSYLAKEGDVILGEQIVTIEAGRVVIRKEGKLLTLAKEEE